MGCMGCMINAPSQDSRSTLGIIDSSVDTRNGSGSLLLAIYPAHMLPSLVLP